MTVAELIKALAAHRADLPVYVHGGQSGIDDASAVIPVTVTHGDPPERFFGTHTITAADRDGAPGLLLSGKA